jgi:glycosyltransferase involved in cell wall biosynthesis
MHVVYFSKYSEQGPSSRHRIYQFLPALEAAGIRCVVRPLFGLTYLRLLRVRLGVLRVLLTIPYCLVRFLRRAWDLLAVRGADLVVIEAQLFPYAPPVVERLLARLGCRLLHEYDDAIYLTWGHRRKIPCLSRLAVGTIVGNEELAREAGLHGVRAVVVPTVVDTERFIPAPAGPSRRAEALTIGWIGLAYNLSYLEALAPVFRRLQRAHGVRLRVVCSRPPRLAGVRVEFVPWRLEREVEDLRGCNIGIMPLPDTAWARGKCGLKLLQYMAVGLSVVASPVGVNREIIVDGENGLLAGTEAEWEERLGRLLREETTRARLGRAARLTVERCYALRVWAPTVVALYRRFGARTVAARDPGAEAGGIPHPTSRALKARTEP